MKLYFLFIKYLSLFIKNDKRFIYYEQLMENLSVSRDEIVSLQKKKIKELINHAYNQTEYYKYLFDQNNIDYKSISSYEDIARIPILTKNDIKVNLESIKSNDKFGKSLFRVTSGGSTGEQAVFFKSKYFEEMSRAVWLRNNSIVDWQPHDKSVWIWGSPIENSKLSKSIIAKVAWKLNRRIILNAYGYSKDDFFNWTDTILKFKPKVLFGYSSIIYELAKFIREQNISFPSLKIIVSTTEKLLRRTEIEDAFHCKVFDQYGCREMLSIAIEYKENEMLLTDDVVLTHFGSEGELLLTALDSFGFPLINYKVGDIGQSGNRKYDYLNHKYPFPSLDLQIGRITENFINFSYKTISTSALSTYLSTLELNIEMHQLIQKNFKEFKINFIVSNSLFKQENYEKKVKCVLEKYFGENLILTFNKVMEISAESSGKRLLFKRTFLI
jgi:phenylacetate-coenzyme A ligase PaaK-like adenylate-forming protein